MTPEDARRRAREIAEACLRRHSQFAPEMASQAFNEGWTDACADCIAAALAQRLAPDDDLIELVNAARAMASFDDHGVGVDELCETCKPVVPEPYVAARQRFDRALNALRQPSRRDDRGQP